MNKWLTGLMILMSCSALMGEVLADSGSESEAWIAQKAASTCRGMQLYVYDCETDEEYTVALTTEETEALRQLVCRMQPYITEAEGDVDPSEIVELLFLDAKGECIGFVNIYDVVCEGMPHANPNLSKVLFVLSKQDFSNWNRLIHQAEQRIKQ
ncbi:MAG: hypothetical protein IKT79_02590 [Akkermansia sp.]|nr:hypothetical protein [Akkermansia sp.]